jgi:hypothetical protein
MQRLRNIVGLLAIAGASFAVGSWLRDDASTIVEREVTTTGSPVVHATCPSTDPEAIASVVRRELRGAQHAGTADEEDAAEPPKQPEREAAPDPAREAQRAQVTAMIDRALAARRWTEDDRLVFHELAPALGDAGVKDSIDRIFRALNAQQLRVEFHGPLF